jgi:hypothetical protein
MTRKPKLVWRRVPCPTCGAVTAKEAEVKCAPRVHCPTSGVTDDEDYLIDVTEESLRACEDWERKHA